MAWKEAEVVVPKFELADLLKKESIWYSNYFEPERWHKDLTDEGFYSLSAEYEPDEHTIIKRYELDEGRRAELMPGIAHFYTIIFDRRKMVKKQDP